MILYEMFRMPKRAKVDGVDQDKIKKIFDDKSSGRIEVNLGPGFSVNYYQHDNSFEIKKDGKSYNRKNSAQSVIGIVSSFTPAGTPERKKISNFIAVVNDNINRIRAEGGGRSYSSSTIPSTTVTTSKVTKSNKPSPTSLDMPSKENNFKVTDSMLNNLARETTKVDIKGEGVSLYITFYKGSKELFNMSWYEAGHNSELDLKVGNNELDWSGTKAWHLLFIDSLGPSLKSKVKKALERAEESSRYRNYD